MSANKQPDKFKDYVSVAERIEKFYRDYPQGKILTEVIEHDRDSGFVMMKAEVFRSYDDASPSASGHAYESRDAGYVNKTSYIENCETGCVGRALANLGLEVKRGIASREEMQKVERFEGRQLQAVESTDTGAPPTPQQINIIKGLRVKLKITSPLDFSKLTYGTAEKYIADLNAME